MDRQEITRRKQEMFPIHPIGLATQELEAFPDDSTARMEALGSIVAFLRRHGFSKEAVLVAWAFAEAEQDEQ